MKRRIPKRFIDYSLSMLMKNAGIPTAYPIDDLRDWLNDNVSSWSLRWEIIEFEGTLPVSYAYNAGHNALWVFELELPDENSWVLFDLVWREE